MNALQLIPARYRQAAYALYALVGVIVGAVQVGYASSSTAAPEVLTVILAVYAFVGGALGLTAAANTETVPQLEPVEEAPDHEDPDDDLLPPPGQHRAED